MDNQSAMKIAMSSASQVNERTNHIDIRYHFVRDAYQQGRIRIEYLPTADMTADILTKSLPVRPSSATFQEWDCGVTKANWVRGMAVGGWETEYWRYQDSTYAIYSSSRFLLFYFTFFDFHFFPCIMVGGPGGYSFLSSHWSRYGFNEARSGQANIFLFP